MMLMTITGKYRNGRIELNETPKQIANDALVIVTFIETSAEDLRAHGISEREAAELRAKFAMFEDWHDAEMTVYDDYDAAKRKLRTR